MSVEIPPEGPMPELRDLTDEEYDATYASGTGGHEIPAHVLAMLNPEESTDE